MMSPLLVALMFVLDNLATKHVHLSIQTGGVLEYLMAVFAISFNNEITTFLYALVLSAIPYSLRHMLLIMLLPSTGLLITYILKRVISRPRPSLYAPRCKALVFDFRGRERNHSMPSVDSLQAAMFWIAVAYFSLIPYWAAGFLIALTMTARVYYMCHYPSDTVLGAIIGVSNFFLLKHLILIP
jgi:membrane-associated phospholipid phosphatase